MNQALQPCSRQSEEPIGGWGDKRTHTTDYTHKNTQARQRYVINSASVKINTEMTGLLVKP